MERILSRATDFCTGMLTGFRQPVIVQPEDIGADHKIGLSTGLARRGWMPLRDCYREDRDENSAQTIYTHMGKRCVAEIHIPRNANIVRDSETIWAGGDETDSCGIPLGPATVARVIPGDDFWTNRFTVKRVFDASGNHCTFGVRKCLIVKAGEYSHLKNETRFHFYRTLDEALHKLKYEDI